MAIKQGTGALIALCIFFFIAGFLVYHPFFSERVLEFLEYNLDIDIPPAYTAYGRHERVQMLNTVSGIFLLISLVMGILACLWQLGGEKSS